MILTTRKRSDSFRFGPWTISINFSVNPDQVHQMCTNFSLLMSNQEQFILHNINFYALSFFLGCFQASSRRYLCPGDRWTWISHHSVAPHVEWKNKTMSLISPRSRQTAKAVLHFQQHWPLLACSFCTWNWKKNLFYLNLNDMLMHSLALVLCSYISIASYFSADDTSAAAWHRFLIEAAVCSSQLRQNINRIFEQNLLEIFTKQSS